MRQTLTTFGGELMHEISDPAVIAMFRLAIAEAVYAPEIAQALGDIGIGTSRDAWRWAGHVGPRTGRHRANGVRC